ncbi:HTH-type transcriptional regulator HdfR [compost metagenome]
MDPRDLAYFETIAELGHQGRAAERLCRSQPALTKSIQRLEESLGASLFQRDGRRIKLTPAGHLLLERSRQLRHSVDETRREVRDFANGLVGNIRLGCAVSMAEYLLPQLTATLLSLAPNVTLTLTVGMDDVLREGLLQGNLDLVISPYVDKVEGLETHALLEDQAVVVARRDHPLFSGPISQRELCRYRWVLPPLSASARKWIDNAFISRQLPTPMVQVESTSISLMPRLIARTDLLSFIAREHLLGGKAEASLREIPLAETTMTRVIGVSYRSEGYKSPATATLLDILLTHQANLFLQLDP